MSDGCWMIASLLPLPAVSETGPDAFGTYDPPASAKVSVYVATVPVSVRAVNAAAPAVPVTAVAPLRVAPAGLTLAFTVTPARATALPSTSCNCTTGCGDMSSPLTAVPGGAVVRSSFVGLPGFRSTFAEFTGVNGGSDVNCSVRIPTAPLILRSVNVATPAASVTAVVVPHSVPPPVKMAACTVTPACATALPHAS